MQKLPLHKPYQISKGVFITTPEALLVFKIHNYTKVMISLLSNFNFANVTAMSS